MLFVTAAATTDEWKPFVNVYRICIYIIYIWQQLLPVAAC